LAKLQQSSQEHIKGKRQTLASSYYIVTSYFEGGGKEKNLRKFCTVLLKKQTNKQKTHLPSLCSERKQKS
jgi:hypothetical protein